MAVFGGNKARNSISIRLEKDGWAVGRVPGQGGSGSYFDVGDHRMWMVVLGEG